MASCSRRLAHFRSCGIRAHLHLTVLRDFTAHLRLGQPPQLAFYRLELDLPARFLRFRRIQLLELIPQTRRMCNQASCRRKSVSDWHFPCYNIWHTPSIEREHSTTCSGCRLCTSLGCSIQPNCNDLHTFQRWVACPEDTQAVQLRYWLRTASNSPAVP